MLYAKIENDEVVEFPLNETALRKALSHTSLPKEITEESLEGTGYAYIGIWSSFEKPEESYTHSLALGMPVKTEHGWERTWTLREVPPEKLEPRRQHKLKEIRAKRDVLLARADKVLNRYWRQERLGLPITVPLEKIDIYMQELADVTDQPDLWNIVWPELR